MGVIQATSVTNGPNGQKMAHFEQWNLQDWFNQDFWRPKTTQTEEDWDAGAIAQWSDNVDKMVRPALLEAADGWDKNASDLQNLHQALTSAFEKLGPMLPSGERAGFLGEVGQQLANMGQNYTQAAAHRIAQITQVAPIAAAYRNAADIIAKNAPIVAQNWQKWLQVRNNPMQCNMATQAERTAATSMAQGMLDAANAPMAGYKDIAQWQVVNPLGTPPTAQGSTAPSSTSVAALPNRAATAAQQPGVTVAASSQPASVAAAASTSPTASTSHAATAASTSPAANTVPGVQLAGTAGATLTPPAPTSQITIPGLSSVVPAAGGSAAGPGMLGGLAPGAAAPAGGAGFVGGGMAPFMPMGGIGAAGTGAGAASGSRRRDERDGEDERTRGAVVPPIAPTVGRTGGRAAARIRPGNATRPNRVGVAAGLTGRTAEAEATIGSTKRRRSANRPGQTDGTNGPATVQFLDEEAWQTDDPGSGVLGTEEQRDIPVPVAAVTIH